MWLRWQTERELGPGHGMPHIRSMARAPWRPLVAAAMLAVFVASAARAQGAAMLQGITDLEFWSTDNTSPLLARNDGRPGGVARLTLWGAYEPVPKLVLYAQGIGEAGPARNEYASQNVDADQFGVRYAASPALVVDAGRLAPVVGTFAARRFSTRNPLIGEPDGYPLTYPAGAEVSGELRHFDYRAAMVSLPVSHPIYVPVPTAELRPAIGVGVTPTIGFRVGASYTAGSYLGRSTPSSLLFGQRWDDYHQHVIAADLEFSRGYLETHAEAARGSYEVPGRASAAVGWTYYGEAKYTFTPRLFVAVRLERNTYPFIAPAGMTRWIAATSDFVDGEGGIGYRLTASTLLKTSYRTDRRWPQGSSAGEAYVDGRAFAVQVSQAFDALSWMRRN